jgi:CheY-like chemotaxis protein
MDPSVDDRGPDYARLAHDLNNVLMTISSVTYVLGEKVRGTPADEGEIDELEGALSRATELVKQLKAGTPAPKAVPLPKAEVPKSGRGTVLLVEDEVTVRRVIKRVLETSGYDVIEAVDGQSALQVIEPNLHRLSLLLTDVVMPGLSGLELAEKLLAQRPDLKVIYMTGYLSELERRGGLSPPSASLLTKPFTPSSLIARVRETLAGAGAPSLSLM